MSQDHEQVNPSDGTERFVRLFAANEHEIYRYVLTLVAREQDAQEIVQETSVALWRKMPQYDAAEPFLPWACRFAYFEVLRYRKKQRRDQRYLTDTVLELLSAERIDHQPVLERRREALQFCLKQLDESATQLVQLRYHSGTTVKHMAEMTGRPANTLYKALERIRRRLMQCINKRLAAREAI